MNSFNLIPFDRNTAPNIEVTGNIKRTSYKLEIEYQIKGRSQIIVPATTDDPIRQFDLWEHTCFEFFLGIKDSDLYWEFNLSPSGHWNVFKFLAYRQDIAEEMTFDKLPFQVSSENDSLQLIAKIDLSKIIKPEQNLAVGITTVIEDKDKQLSYWALSHPGKEADFHLRDSFAIAL